MRLLLIGSLLCLFLSAGGGAAAGTLQEDVDGLSGDEVDETVEFTFGNALFFLFHEMGHMLISEFDLPVLGREEDAADTLSTLILLEGNDPLFDKALASSVEGWMLSSDAGEDPEVWDAHSLDQQRAYNIVCMMVGKDPRRFAGAADDIEMPEDRREECADDYAKAHRSWFGLLEPHLRKGGATTAQFQINYKKPHDKELNSYAEITRKAGLLEIVEVAAGKYDLRDNIRLTADECDESNAYWSIEERELTYCYELSQWFTQAKAATYRPQEDEGWEEEEEEEEE